MPWNHNVAYHDVLLSAVPQPCPRALDVGCGGGHFARRLAERAVAVEAIDRAPGPLARARTLSTSHPNVTFVEADLLTHPLPPASYDFLSAIAVLHHLPFDAAIDKWKQALRPGGVLGIVGLYRMRAPLDHLLAAIALPLSHVCRRTRTVPGHVPVDVPLHDPEMTLAEIRAAAHRLLPGATLTRHLFFRYTLLWTKPSSP